MLDNKNKKRDAKNKSHAVTTAELERLIEALMLDVAFNHPYVNYCGVVKGLKPQVENWAKMTAMYVTEVVKRRSSPRETIIRTAKKALRRRLEKTLADSYLRLVFPSRPKGVSTDPTISAPASGGVPPTDDAGDATDGERTQHRSESDARGTTESDR